MKKLFTIISVLVVFLFSSFSAQPCFAYLDLVQTMASEDQVKETETATEQLKDTTDKILVILQNKELSQGEKDQQMLEVADERFRWTDIARGALSRKWKNITAEEREEFTSLFRKLIFNVYMEKTRKYDDKTEITYTDEKLDSKEYKRKDGTTYTREYAKVFVEIDYHETLVGLEYRMKKYDDQWLVYDVLVEGISLVNNYRAQFRGMDYEDIISWLREKVGTKPEKEVVEEEKVEEETKEETEKTE